MGGEWLRTDGKTHLELNTNLHSSLDDAVVTTAILSAKIKLFKFRIRSTPGLHQLAKVE